MLECSVDFRLLVTSEENRFVARDRARKGRYRSAYGSQWGKAKGAAADAGLADGEPGCPQATGMGRPGLDCGDVIGSF